jgi:hypothetical protein
MLVDDHSGNRHYCVHCVEHYARDDASIDHMIKVSRDLIEDSDRGYHLALTEWG